MKIVPECCWTDDWYSWNPNPVDGIQLQSKLKEVARENKKVSEGDRAAVRGGERESDAMGETLRGEEKEDRVWESAHRTFKREIMVWDLFFFLL
jgi:hypothetical protein